MSLPFTQESNSHNPTNWNKGSSRVAASVCKWPQTRGKANVQTSLDAFINIPAVSVVNPAGGNWLYSYVVAQFNYSVGQSFSLKAWQNISFISSGSFVAVVRFYTGNKVTRYSIWNTWNNISHTDEGFYLNITPYSGQVIPSNFSIEIWSFPDFSLVLGASSTILTSILIPITPTTNPGDSLAPICVGNPVSELSFTDAGATFDLTNFPLPIPFSPTTVFTGN